MQAFQTIQDARAYALAGNALITLESLKTGAHYTYKIQAPKKETERGGLVTDFDADVRFVKVLASGSADEGEFVYLGMVKNGRFSTTGKSKHMIDAPSAKAFQYFMSIAELNPLLAIRHHGICGRCGRTLTEPESIDTGFGSVCRAEMGL